MPHSSFVKATLTKRGVKVALTNPAPAKLRGNRCPRLTVLIAVTNDGEFPMLGTILLILLVLLLVGALPTWGYSGSWGYGPSGLLGVVLVVVLVLVLIGRV
jgi:hypothetical protein